ncbi:DUF4340 domain-containing protein [Aliiglaciecola litoralis]|uniref:DUF4340 domain-containing protein n=1 Tax=Aliiglaciecola litoralis TaxID=582857 RepID=A0ABP3WSB0_9ALTE
MNKQLVSLIILLAIVGAAIYYLFVQSAMHDQDKVRLFPTLADNATRVERIKISSVNGVLLDAVPARSGWQTRLDGVFVNYPVDQAQLAGLLEGLSQAVLFEAKTKRPENFDKLNLTDVSNPDSLATLVEVSRPGKTHKVLIGSQASSGQGTYARLVDNNQSWLLDQSIQLPTDGFDWLRQPILDFDVKQLSAIARMGDKGFSIQRNQAEDGAFELTNLQPNQALKYATVIDGFVESVVNLSFDKILTDAEANWSAETDIITYEISLEDGTAIQMQLLNADPKAWVKFSRVTSTGQSYWDGLSYQISNFSAQQLDKQVTDFIKSESQAQQSQTRDVNIDEGESPSGE